MPRRLATRWPSPKRTRWRTPRTRRDWLITGGLRVLRLPLPLLLGAEAIRDHRPDGMPAAWCLASPKIGEREVAAALLAHARRNHALRPGLVLIGDKGFAGREFEQLATASLWLSLVRPDRRDEVPRHAPSAGSASG